MCIRDRAEALAAAAAQIVSAPPKRLTPQNVMQSALRHTARFDVPETPEMSPANNDVHHHPTAAAEAFMRRIFVDWNTPRAFQAEDAGIELICEGWTGAVAQKLASASSSHGKQREAPMEPSTRTLYVHMPRFVDRSALRDHLLRILDAASERLCAGRVVFCLERNLPDLSSLLRGLCYVGGQVTSLAGQPDAIVDARPIPALVLVSVAL